MNHRAAITASRRIGDFLLPTLDAAAVMASLMIVKLISRGWVDDHAFAMVLVAIVVFLLASQLTGLHRRFHSGSVDGEMTTIVATWTLTVFVLALLAFVTRFGQHFDRSFILGWIVLAPTLVGLSRMSLRIIQQGMLRRGIGTRRVAIAGLNDLGRQTASNIDRDPGLGLRMTGFYDDRAELRQPTGDTEGLPELDDAESREAGSEIAAKEITIQVVETQEEETLSGSLSDLVEKARRGEVDTILVTLPMRAEDRIRYLLDQLSDSTVSVYIVPDFFVFELLHSRWTNMGGLPAVSVFENPLFGVDGVAKRLADIALAVSALVIAAIPMSIIAILVKLSSPGPVFFRQRRYGLDGKEIVVWKFRSMRTCDHGDVVKQATKDDPRITPIGGILRRTSLDELPQLFNVIDGSMSLVGPRPHASAHNEQYRSLIRGYMLRHKVKPGITGLAQVNGCRGETETVEKMKRRIEWDHNYIRSWSLWLDLKIIFKTAMVVWKQEQAY